MFDTHMLNYIGKIEMNECKMTLEEVVKRVLSLMPDSREKSILITKM